MNSPGIETYLPQPFETAIEKTTEALKKEGFGVLTRIDFDQKIKEKLGHSLPRTAILGACNPNFAYEGYRKNPDMLLVVPCNVVIEELEKGRSKIRMVKPSSMVKALDSPELVEMASQLDEILVRVSKSLSNESGSTS